MTAATETGRCVTPERITRGAEVVERAGFVLRYECPLGQLDDIVGMRSCRALFGDEEDYDVDRAMIDSGILEQLCAQADGDQEPTENWREVLRAL